MDRISSRSERPAPPRDPRAALERHRRDDSLNRVSRLTTRVAIGSLALIGALGLYVSRALPGHTSTTSSSGTASASTSTNQSSAGSSGQASSQGSSAVSPPAAAPVQTQAPAQVSTGAS